MDVISCILCISCILGILMVILAQYDNRMQIIMNFSRNNCDPTSRKDTPRLNSQKY